MGYTCLCIHALKCLLLLPNSMKALLASNSEWKEEKDKKKTDTTERERERVRESVRESVREREREHKKTAPVVYNFTALKPKHSRKL